MPAIHNRFSRPFRFDQQNEDLTQIHFSRAFDQTATAFTIDGFGDLRSPVLPNVIVTTDNSGLPGNFQPVESAWYIPGPSAIVDVYTATTATSGTLVVDGAHIIAASDTAGDNDWFKVTLTAGETYEFGQFAWVGGIPGAEGNGFALADAYLELYDQNGVLVSAADGGGPNTPNGLDALMTFQATYTGTYYVNATSYDQTGDGVGDFAGDYEIFAQTATGLAYSTEYDISSPLHSIDWGGVRVNREHVAVENPDGMEGPRVTGDPAADPADVEGNALGFPGKNVIYLYFAGEGDTYFHQDSTIPAQVVVQNPYQYEVQAMLNAANEFSKVADVVFVSNYTLNATTGLYERDESIEYKPGPSGPEDGVDYAAGVDDGFDADFFYFSYPGTPGPGISLLGSMNPPDYGDEGVAQFNSADERWNAQMLQPGGFSFVTLIHEFGHGMGLAHPHDTGGGSSVMPGVNPLTPGDDGGAGTHGLNQGVYTMMSYNDGWESSPYGSAETNNEGYGWLGSLMALDIAVIQDKYGVNEEWATGNDTYVLKDANQWGVYIDAATGEPAVHDATNATTTRDGYYVGDSTSYRSIWDADGVDQIVYSGARNANIDLRAATLQYETGGAGWMSYATGIFGGFTIANGVTIENATSGSGNDTLIGNAVANSLDGGAGNDVFDAGDGADRILGGAGADYVVGGLGHDEAYGQSEDDLVGGEAGNDFIDGGSGVDRLYGDDGNDFVIGGLGGDQLYGQAGIDRLEGGADDDMLDGGLDNDALFGGDGFDSLYGGSGNDQLAGEASDDLMDGGDGDDVADGGAGADRLTGGTGNDYLFGGVGNDLLYGQENEDTIGGGEGNDLIDGGLGADRLYGDAGADYIVGGDGNDLIFGQDDSDTIGGQAGDNSIDGGAGADNLYGDDGNDAIVGGAGADQLYGQVGNDNLSGGDGDDLVNGGLGNDALAGGAGADGFVFDSGPLGAANADTIADFQSGIDKIRLDDAVFTGLGLGALSAGAFVTGTAAQDADDRIIYNSATGALLFDADGNGAGAAVQFATLTGNPPIVASDFTVI